MGVKAHHAPPNARFFECPHSAHTLGDVDGSESKLGLGRDSYYGVTSPNLD